MLTSQSLMENITLDDLRTRICGSRKGQAVVEYVVVAAVLMASIAILAVFLYAFRENGGRILDLVASEYP